MQIIRVHADAPLKPAPGADCNGCGVCCLAEPCPLGMLLSLRRTGACRMLRWDDGAGRYRCGALAARGWAPIVRRWIAAGRGCDCTLEITR
ncbi:MAG: hypothetical protein KF788_13820 [Piscinibacter sp.]|nr:hypothetical protein [Piscinibacter sp.]